MKWAVRILVSMLVLVSVVVGGLALWPWVPVGAERLGATTYRAHLDANETVLDLTAPDAALALAPEHYGARYIILGEMHGYGIPQTLDLAMVRHLAETGPPRWYLAELTPTEAIAVNEYVGGGSDEAVREVFDRFARMNAQWANRDFFEKLTAIRVLNETLPAGRRVWFVGIDKAREPALAQGGTEAAEPPDLSRRTAEGARAVNVALAAVLEEASGRYPTFRARMDALAAMPGWDEAAFYGLWGLFHASEAAINGALPFAAWLQEDGAAFSGDVVTINTLCFGACFNMMPAQALPPPLQGPSGEVYTYLPMGMQSPYFQRPKGASDLIAALGDDRAALYAIGSTDSPYRQGRRLTGSTGYLVMLQPWDVEGSAAGMTDYVVAYRDSPPLRPWRGEAYDASGKAAAALGG